MKPIYTALFLLCSFYATAQDIFFPDINLKALLVESSPDNDTAKNLNGDYFSVDANDDGEIQLSEALEVSYLRVFSSNIGSLEGITYFENLVELRGGWNAIPEVDLSGMENLEIYWGHKSQTTSFNFSGCTNLQEILISQNMMTSLDLSNLSNLERLFCNEHYTTNTLDINLNGCESLSEVELNDADLESIDLSGLVNLEYLSLIGNNLTSLEISELTNLIDLDVRGNQLSELNVSNNLALTVISAQYNNLTSIDLSNTHNLTELSLSFNLLTELNVNECFNLDFLACTSNPNLSVLMMKNGINESANYFISGNTSLAYVCCDDFEEEEIQTIINNNVVNNGGMDAEINGYCSFSPGGEYYTIQGDITLDANSNGCDSEDTSYPQLHLNITDGSNAGVFYSNNQGSYHMPIQAGNYTITPQLENPNYFSVSPNPLSVDFPSDSSPFTQDFCITPNGTFNDLEIIIIPLELPTPGFETDYKIIYKNNGTTVLSGNINLSFDDNLMDFQSATPTVNTQSTGNLSWNYSDLEPFETREVLISMLLNAPTDPTYPLNLDDILNFTTSISPSEADESPEDNTFSLPQEVVNSFDPNDKTCLEGEIITLEQVGKYVHYLIRFENNGTANAVNIVVKDIIDEVKFDLSTLIPLNSSHDFFTRIQNGNELEFIFEDIQLPFDDANNDGYILFKIKTLETLNEGSSFSNDAEIFFDYNFPIITNNVTTTIVNGLSTTEFLIDPIRIYPNPTDEILHIDAKNYMLTKATITDINGRLILAENISNQSMTSLNVSSLNPGVYFVNIFTNNGNQMIKMVKQ